MSAVVRRSETVARLPATDVRATRGGAPARAAGRERGFATLATVLLLVSVAAIAVLHMQLEWLAERQLDANQARAAAAAEAAEAGLAWAVAMLADPRPAGADCRPDGAGASVLARLRPTPASAEPSRARCRLTASGPDCRCDGAPAPAGDGAAFSVTLGRIDADTLRVDALGCDGAASGCQPGATDQLREAHASASLRLGRSPLLRSLPAAALTVDGDLLPIGPSTLTNLDEAAGGWLAAATGALALDPAASLRTPPGVAASQRLLPHARAIEAPSWRLYGRDAVGIAANALVARIDGGDAAARGRQVGELHAQGYAALHVTGDVDLGASPAGTAERPVLLFVTGDVACSGTCELHGLLHAHGAIASTLSVQGAVVIETTRAERLPGAITYRSDVLATLRDRLAEHHVALPGSWHDE